MGMSPSDLAELLRAFNDVTEKLRTSHDQLTREVTRLRDELGEANVQLERARRLSALGEMAAGIAHEVRNPLGGIALYARMLEDDLRESPAQAELASKIASAARSINQIVGDVLAFAKEMRVRLVPMDARDVFERALEACAASAMGVQVVREGFEKEVVIHADPHLLHQALVNVIDNALQVMAEQVMAGQGGSPAQATRKLVLSLKVRGMKRSSSRGGAAKDGGGVREVSLVVRDTGPGVSPEVIARMFNPFFTTRAAGTGLGLAIVHRIMDAHAGRVLVRNAVDDRLEPGAIVELVLPAGAQSLPGALAEVKA
jgi:signal transduction histidine kinase